MRRSAFYALVWTAWYGISLSAFGQQAAQDTEQVFQKLLEEYYQADTARPLIESKLRSLDLRSFDAAQSVVSFVRRKSDEKMKTHGIGNIIPSDLPSLEYLGLPGQWVTQVEGGIDRILKLKAKDEGLSEQARNKLGRDPSDAAVASGKRLEAVADRLTYGITHGDPGRFSEAERKKLSDAYFRVYADMGSSHRKSQYDFALQSGMYLQYGAWLGDKRALLKAKELIESYLKNPSQDAEGDFQSAVFAVQSFKTKDYGLSVEASTLLSQVQNSTATPVFVRKKIAGQKAEPVIGSGSEPTGGGTSSSPALQ